MENHPSNRQAHMHACMHGAPERKNCSKALHRSIGKNKEGTRKDCGGTPESTLHFKNSLSTAAVKPSLRSGDAFFFFPSPSLQAEASPPWLVGRLPHSWQKKKKYSINNSSYKISNMHQSKNQRLFFFVAKTDAQKPLLESGAFKEERRRHAGEVEDRESDTHAGRKGERQKGRVNLRRKGPQLLRPHRRVISLIDQVDVFSLSFRRTSPFPLPSLCMHRPSVLSPLLPF
mmetsp:Transcript_14629/g.29505  ORF Transcript_14629/g.29505 Transcript_14629/m.29505 type:complete len:230 (-) Transcript_14629:254-943(-)